MCHGQIVSTRILTARKQGQPCGICERPIKPGRTYVMHAYKGLDGNKLDNWKLCRKCAAWWEEEFDGDCPMDLIAVMQDDAHMGGWKYLRAKINRGWKCLRERAGK